MLLSDKEKAFLDYWQQNRAKKGRISYQFLHSLPLGIIFALPILAFFLLEAQRDRALITPADLILICIGIFLIAVFYGFFRSKFDWEKSEDLYQAILKKQQRENLISPREENR